MAIRLWPWHKLPSPGLQWRFILVIRISRLCKHPGEQRSLAIQLRISIHTSSCILVCDGLARVPGSHTKPSQTFKLHYAPLFLKSSAVTTEVASIITIQPASSMCKRPSSRFSTSRNDLPATTKPEADPVNCVTTIALRTPD